MSSEWNIEFVVTSPLEVEETYSDRAILSGVFLKLADVTRNGREYQVEEGAQIATLLQGMPVYFGADPLTGKHKKGEPFKVGNVINTLFDKVKKIISGKVEVWNTKLYPDLISRIKKGWGFSIGGKAMDLQPTGFLNELGRKIKRVLGMRPNHMQLIPPTTIRGQDEAQVEDIIPVEETFELSPCSRGACEVDADGNITQISNDGDTEETLEGEPEVIVRVITGRKVYILEDPDSKLV